MRKLVLVAAGWVLIGPALFYAAPPQQEPPAEAARKAREKKKNQPKAARVFTNDDLTAAHGTVSVVGEAPAAGAPSPAAEASTEGEKKPTVEGKGEAPKKAESKEETPTKDEAYWRKRFADARGKIRMAEKELDILQRELNLQTQQYYSDPNKALRQQYDRSDINNLRKTIDDKKAEVQKLRQNLSDLEDELRREGGDPGWSREP
ncbi:MAG TPA: hypothetical protein VHM88_01915 [Candidatus Acidoferrales bacterium]|jgi:predicted RNase H-like nuclease (RuvC/YqgF family)|nr:hypothetical protein [Candidatus Acidoferrales bacterium]